MPGHQPRGCPSFWETAIKRKKGDGRASWTQNHQSHQDFFLSGTEDRLMRKTASPLPLQEAQALLQAHSFHFLT